MRAALVVLLVCSGLAAAAAGRTSYAYSGHPRYAICSSYTKIYNAQHGYIRSGGNTYENNLKCSWRISLPPSFKNPYRLHFTKFDLEYGNRHCPYDKVKVYDGSSNKGTLRGTFCGTKRPSDIITKKGGDVFISFTTDGSVKKKGFEIRYSIVSCSRYTKKYGTRGLFGTSGSSYGIDEYCVWKITVHRDKRVRIRFIKFDIEKSIFSTSCKYDYVKIRDGSRAKVYCGNKKPADFVSSRNYAYVIFKSDLSNTRDGFLAWYYAVDPPLSSGTCRRLTVITQETGVIGTSGSHYANNLQCAWRFQVRQDRRVVLMREHFDLEPSSSCSHDSVKVYEGVDRHGRLRGTYCGTNFPSQIISRGTSLYVTFTTDGSKTRSGFRLRHAQSVWGPG